MNSRIMSLRHATWVPAGVWIAALFYLLTAQFDVGEARWMLPHLDKLVHFVFFSVLAWLLVWPTRSSLGLRKDACLFASFLLATLYGAGMEYWQSTLPHRHGNWADVVANGLGAATVFVLYWVPFHRFRPKSVHVELDKPGP